MFDFPFTQPSAYTAIFAMLSYFFFLLSGKRVYMNGTEIKAYRTLPNTLILIFYVLISTHCINGDFFSLMQKVHDYDFTAGAYHSQEPVYVLIAQFFGKNYLLFRLTVWGIAVACMALMYKKLKLNFYFGFWLFLACYSILFAYARASAAMAVYYLGFVLFTRKGGTVIAKFVGVCMLLLSYEFHHSMLILILLTPLAFLTLNKLTFYAVLGALPFIIIFVRIVFSAVLDDISILDDETLQRKMQSYSLRENSQFTLRTQIMDGIKYASAYIPFVVSSYYIVIKKAFKILTKGQYRLFVFTFWLFIIATAVSFLNLEVNVFFYRILFMAIIPSIAIFVSLIQNHVLTKKIVMRMLYISIISQMLNYLYMLYLNTIN